MSQYNELLSKVLARDLRFDSGELEQTADLLAGKKRSLQNQIAQQPDIALKAALQRQLTLVELGAIGGLNNYRDVAATASRFHTTCCV